MTRALGHAIAADDERGQTLAEYGLILGFIVVVVMVAAVFAFRGSIIGSFSNGTECINHAVSSTDC
ncbi:MAG TPA: Flp family type IVb pilin [Dehalococcoidia bacterium]|nr:Flp family type IVb pilin [Dehalococcoidia bacterium]